MKAGWEESSMGDLCALVRGPFGGSLKKAVFKPSGYAVYEQQHAIRDQFEDFRYFVDQAKFDEMARFSVSPGDIIMSCSGTMGKIAKVPKFAPVGIINQALLKISPLEKVNSDFLMFWMESPGFQDELSSTTMGVAIKNVASVKTLKGMPIPLPPLEEQQRIVAVLDEDFEGLARVRTHVETNLQNARELFESAVNSTVLGELHERPEEVQDVGLRQLIEEQSKRVSDKKFRGPRFVASKEVPNLPKGWTWASPEQLCTHIIDCLHATPKWTSVGEICLRTTNFRVGELDMTELRYVSPETYEKRIARLEPKPGDVLYSREGGILGIACMHPPGLKACLGQRMMHFRLKVDVMIPEFFCAVLNSALVLGEVRHFTGGAAAPHLNIGDIRQFPIPVPPLCEQKAMVEIIESHTNNRRLLQSAYGMKIQDLEDLRQSLLQKAFAGELT
ncbi:MAG: restriction endonuclease subunit S [Hyphomicrobiales bacterium]